MSGDELDDLDAQIAALQAKKATKLAKAEIARKAEEKEAKKILIGATPTKGQCTLAPSGSHATGRLTGFQ